MSNRFLDRGMSFIRNFGGNAEGKDAASGGASGGRPTVAASTPPRDSVDDLSREELLQLCIKLKKRMRALEAKHREVVRSHRSVIRTLADLQHLTLDVCGIPAASVTDDKTGFVHVASLQAAWRAKDAARRDHADGVVKKLQFQLQQAKADAVQQRTASSRRIVELQDKLAAVRAARVAAPIANGSKATQQHGDGASAAAGQGGGAEDSGDGGAGADAVVGDEHARGAGAGNEEDLQQVVDELRIDLQLQKKWAAEHETAWEEENESLRSTLSDRERRIAHLQRAAASDAEALESAKANLEEARAKHRKSVSELEQLRTALELANGARDELEVTTRMDLARFKKEAAESAAKVQQLTASLQEATAKAQRCDELSRQVASLQSELNNSTLLNAEKRLVMDELRAQIAATKASEERRAEVAIAKAEDDAAAARAELAEFKAIAASFGGAAAANGGSISGTPNAGAPAGGGSGSGGGGSTASVAMVPASQLQEVKAQNEDLEAAMKALKDELSRRIAAAEATAAAAKAAKARLQEEIETVTRAKDEADAAHRAALRAARAEASAKSLRARQLIQDKDQEIAALRTKVKELTEDVESGAPTERRLMALAEETAKQDAQAAQQKARIGDLSARLQAAAERADRLDREVQALRRAASMVGPNLEYLKNVVLRYMSFEAGSAEKRSLVPVIATLLKFSRAEVAQVSKSRGFSLFSFGSKPKPVLPPGHPPAMPAGAGGAGGAGAGAGIAATGTAGTAALSRGVAGSTVVTVPPSPPTGVR